MNSPETAINDRNFNDRFRAYLKSNPHDWRMIRSAAKRDVGNGTDLSEEQSVAWFNYLRDRGMLNRFKTWRGIVAAGHKSIMVPCESPEVFDLAYIPKSRTAKPPTPPKERAVIANGLRRLARDMQFHPSGSLACTPHDCPKEPGRACPNRGTGICRETTEVHYRAPTRSPVTLNDVKECIS